MTRAFLTADISELVKKLKTDEKIALLGAPNWWNTTSVHRLNIPAVRMSDGPNVGDAFPALNRHKLHHFRIYFGLGRSGIFSFRFNSCTVSPRTSSFVLTSATAHPRTVCNLSRFNF